LQAAGGVTARPETARFPWEAVLAFGLGRLRLLPASFWALSLPEFAAMAGISPAGGFAIARRRLEQMMTQFPDGGTNG